VARFACLAALVALCGACSPANEEAAEVQVAVAANFLAPARALEVEFERTTGHALVMIAGSTGQLYAQIVNGAPFDILLAADQERPRLLAEQGAGVPASIFTYAVGRLALWSREPDRVDEALLANLGTADFRWLAIANPELAPYGAAAEQTLEALGLWDAIQQRLVRGQSIAQTFALVETRNAELGFVALSQALAYEGEASYAVVPEALHAPIRQDAILLERGSDNPAARAFIEFVASDEAALIVERFGYVVPPAAD
jgi:molybdate transport system substrate-binding protein